MKPNTPNVTAARRPDGLLVVTVDGLPAWMLPAFGATWVSMPAIDGLAARGIVFDRMITAATDPDETLRQLAGTEQPDGLSLVRVAAARGWKPALVTDDPAVAARFADAINAEVTLVAATPQREEAAADAETSLARLVAAAVAVIRSGRHGLVWCHVSSLGVVWDAPRRYRDRYVDPEDPAPPAGAAVPTFAVSADTDPDLIVGARQIFAGQLTLFDAEIGRLFAAVRDPRESSVEPAWTILFAGIRGMPLGLHGWVGGGGPDTPYGEVVHVPAILVDAGGRMAAQRYGGLVVPADVASTAAELVAGGPGHRANLDSASPWLGMSLVALFEDWCVTQRDRVVVGAAESVAIVTPSWHCVGRRSGLETVWHIELYAKPDDFFESTDVADRCPGVVEPLAELFVRIADGDGRGLWTAALPEATPA